MVEREKRSTAIEVLKKKRGKGSVEKNCGKISVKKIWHEKRGKGVHGKRRGEKERGIGKEQCKKKIAQRETESVEGTSNCAKRDSERYKESECAKRDSER